MNANILSQLLDAIKETQSWLDSNAATATTEEFEEQKEKLNEVVTPITTKMYGSGGDDHAGGMPDYDDDEPSSHDELQRREFV